MHEGQMEAKSSSKLVLYSILGLKKSQMNKTWQNKNICGKKNCVEYQ